MAAETTRLSNHPLETLVDDVEYLDYVDHLAFGGALRAWGQVVHIVQMVHVITCNEWGMWTECDAYRAGHFAQCEV